MKRRILVLTIAVLFLHSCKNIETPKNSVLGSYDYRMPDFLKEKVENGKNINHTFKREFKDIGSEFTIILESIEIDSLNSIIKSVEVILDKSSRNCTFTSSIDTSQLNTRTKENMLTYTKVQVGYIKNSILYRREVNNIFVITSDGKCDLLTGDIVKL